ncbi:histone-lysine N-methyltransferase ASHH2-like [Rutidosis leptorrhynchoides]|uniref:histone-lysine N-methyltransferase ASHH2-like n=1 Tax=Rutidosis leptorrhynchoides TaxID=125765 RepID=UPI003A9A52DB
MATTGSEILPAQDAYDPPLDFNEHALAMEPSCLVDALSVYMESCEPFTTSNAGASNEPTISKTEALVDPFNSIVLTESSDPRNNDGKVGNKVNEIKRPSSRRSTRKVPSNKETVTNSGSRKSKRTSGKKLMLDLYLVDVQRRRRSDLARPPRFSAWGLGVKIDEIFENAPNNVDVVENVESVKGRTGCKGGKRNTEYVNQGVHSQGESRDINKGILLKLKLGTKTLQNCQINMIPDMDRDLESYREVDTETPALQSDIKGNFEKEISRASNENLVSLKSSVIDTLLTEKEKSEDFVGKTGSQVLELPGIGESVENRCLDPGTSPDSEVINLISEAQISGSITEDIRGPSKNCVPNQSGEGGVGSRIPSPEIVNDVLSCEKPLQETEVGVSMDKLTFDSILTSDVSFAQIESPESKSNVQDFQKSSRSKSLVNKKSSNCGQKGSPSKSISKGIFKEISGKDRADCDAEIHLVAGNLEVSDVREPEDGFGSIVEPLCNSSTVPVTNDGASRQGTPQSAWVCCDDCHKWRRISAILADSINLTGSRWICKDNMDKAFGDCSIPQEMSNADINLELELSEASGEEDAGNTQLRQKQPIDPPQASWKLIKTNMFLHRNRKNQPIDEVMVCHCKPPLDGRMGCREECLNRMLNIECVKGTCPCGESCSNQQFQKRKYSKLKRVPSGKKGYGLQLLEDIPKGRFLIEYVGEVLDMHAYAARQKEYASKGHKHFYFMTLNGSEVIDACAKGNLGRFINHSCEPNCRTEKWMVNGEVCIGLFAISDIKKGEELTFDYNYVRVFGAAAKKCVCGSSKCRGVIGGDPLNDETVVLGDSDDEHPEPVTFYENTINKPDGILSETHTVESISKDDNCEIDKFPSASDLNDEEKSLSPDSLLAVEEKNEDPTNPNVKSEITSDRVAEKDTKELMKKPKLHTNSKKSTVLKSKYQSKLASMTSAVKKEKLKSMQPDVDKKPLVVPQKPKRLVIDNLTGRFDAVEEALNTLLNKNKGISKRRDASKGYLTLLCLTAYGGNGKGIQSNRDLSMILGALLHTKSRTVLVDIINKNGLQMLHILLKRCRKDFDKTPILRMLLKVFEYLAETKILTLENILKPSPHGGESLKESILSFTEHDNKQVHTISRNFRDRFIPRHARRVNWAERDHERIEYPPSSNFKSSHSFNRERWPSEDADNNTKQSLDRNTPPVDTKPTEGSSASCNGPTDPTRTRKRKSRWDEPGVLESLPNKESRLKTDNADVDGDAPPGFSSPVKRSNKPVMGQPQERYNSRLPTSFGIPLSVLKKTGTSNSEVSESWIVGPAMTFHPFPPLPLHPREKERVQGGPFSQPDFQRFRNMANTVDRRYFKQQKWNHPRPGHQWPHPNKYGPPHFNGPNHPNVGVRYGSNEVNGTHNTENYENGVYQQSHQ